MEAKEYKLENVLGKLVKELRGNKHLVMSHSEDYPCLVFEVGKESSIPGRYNPLGRIDVGDLTGKIEMTLLIYGGKDFLKDKKKVLSIAQKDLMFGKEDNQ